MPMYYTAKSFVQTMASGLTIPTTGVDLGQTWDDVYLEVPTFASGGTIYVQAAASLAGTYRRVYERSAGTPVQFQTLSSQAIMPIPAGFQFYKVESTSGTTDTQLTYRFHVK